MDPARWQRVQELFHLARARPPAERSAFLDDACDDPDVRIEVLGLLDATPAEQTTFLDPLVRIDGAASPDTDHKPDAGFGALTGRTLGDCQLLELIAEGGMGAVYKATQAPWGRRVAVKVIRGLPTEEARHRFDFEARVLGTLQHPAIAQILASGVHTDLDMGIEVPYFVMEFVPDASRITDYANANGLDVRARKRGDARQSANKIDQNPLGGQHAARRSRERGQRLAGGDLAAVVEGSFQAKVNVHLAEGHLGCRQSGDHPALTRHHRRPARPAASNQGQRGPVEQPIEILAHRQSHDLPAIFLDRRVPLDLLKFSGHARSCVRSVGSVSDAHHNNTLP